MGGIVIPVGTPCLLIGDHTCAGATCTVVEPEKLRRVWSPTAQKVIVAMGYRVDVPGHTSPFHPDDYWAARTRHLMPISPPPETVDERETVAIHA